MQYGTSLVRLSARMVMAGCSLRGASRILQILRSALGWVGGMPHWSTVRTWLQRLGHAKLTSPLQPADDWAWLIDHSVQIGREKCLVILGIRLRDLPAPERCLEYKDMEEIALVPRVSWTREEVAEQLERAVERTGVPRVIVDDHGVDLTGGVSIFQGKQPRTIEIYDVKHKAACLLKRRLEKKEQWQEFQQQLGQTRCLIQQTELSFLVPPSPKPKARFMNLEPLLRWGEQVLRIVESPSEQVLQWTSRERLREKLGWVVPFRTALQEWGEWQHVVDLCVQFVGQHGLYRGAARDLRRLVPKDLRHGSSRVLARELVKFVRSESSKARPGERLPGSTEVLESCFGKLKELEKHQAKGGFTSLLVSFGVMLQQLTPNVVRRALQRSHTKDVTEWCHENLGTTLFARRRIAFAKSATKPG